MRALEIQQLYLIFSHKHLSSTWQVSNQSLRQREKKIKVFLLLTSFEISKEWGTTLNKSPLSLPLMLSSRCLQFPLFLSRPSQGVLKLSDPSEMFTSSPPLFLSVLCSQTSPDKGVSWFTALLHPPNYLTLAGFKKKICLQESNFIGGRDFLLPV